MARVIMEARVDRDPPDIFELQGLSPVEAIDQLYWRSADRPSNQTEVWSSFSPIYGFLNIEPMDGESIFDFHLKRNILVDATQPLINALREGRLTATGFPEPAELNGYKEAQIPTGLFVIGRWVLYRANSFLEMLNADNKKTGHGYSLVKLVLPRVARTETPKRSATSKPQPRLDAKSAAVDAAIKDEWPKGIPSDLSPGERNRQIRKQLEEKHLWRDLFGNTKPESFERLVQRRLGR
jgi:hypothetical protein